MRFHQPLGVVANNNNDYISVSINETNPDSQFIITSDQLAKINPCHVISNVTESVNLTQLKSIVIDKRNENFNNFDSSLDSHKTTTLDNILKFKSQSKYFRSYLQSQETDTKSIDSGNGNNGIIFIETLNFIEDNLTELATLSPTSPTYDNCITNQSYNVQKCLSSFQRQRRENLIKLDLESHYMTKHEGLMQMGVNSAGCSVESSPVDSLLDDQELLSPSSSSCADLSSPDPNDLQQHRRYPRGIINPNYPGFQHLAHTLAEHFIDHHQLELSDSEISEDFDFDAAYRSGNLGNVNIMGDINDSNNNNDNINNNADALDKNIDLNRNKNRRSSFSKPRNVVNDLSIMKENQMLMDKGYEDGNDNLLMKSEPKVFCESKHLDLHQENENHLEMSDGEDEECCNVSSNISFKVEIDSSRMDFDEDDDELADLSGEDDAAIKNELENIDKADNDFNENINCDLATYLTQYDFKMDLNKTYKYENEHKTEEECLTDEDNSKLPTPDILIEHNNKKLQNDDNSEDNMNESNLPAVVVVGDESKSEMVDVSQSDDVNDYQPDLIKNITETININDNNEDEGKLEIRRNVKELHENEKGDNERNIIDNGNDEKIINQMQQTETASNSDSNEITIRKNHPLSFESATSTTVDIIGDFGKEIEKEIGLIVSGYRNATNEKFCEELSNEKKAQQSIRPIKDVEFSSKEQELVFDENKFIEHLKYFSKMGDAALSSVEETITMKSTLVDMNDQNVSNMNQFSNDAGDGESLIPTAIVKPKYQKLSFDDRQLPICGSTDDTSWHSQANTLSTTITTTPRKVQKHLPKSQKSFAKQQNRKVVNKGGDLCVDYEMSGDKESINSLRHNQKETDCGVAIVQPIKKIVDANASVNMNDEKNQKSIDISKNRNIMSHKHEQRNRNSTKCEIAVGMNECGDKNINFPSRKSACIVRDCEKKVPTKKKDPKEISDAFDVYNIETALPVIDMEAIETHLMAAKEEEQKRKNDREAIRRRLAMGEEDDYFTDLAASRPIRKPNLQSRLQNGRNLQICFMNEAASDSESSDSETCPKLSQGMNRKKNLQRPSSLMYHRNASLNNNPYNSRPLSVVRSVLDGNEKVERPSTLHLIQASDPSDNNFFTQQARLQIEARMALAQAKDMAHMQMEIEKQKQGMCPITDLVHRTLGKVGLKASPSKRRLSRQMLTTMNIAQLQIIINEFHTFIETLNEMLVKYLMDRDDLSMRQDSMLIDIEDITRYLAEKEEAKLNYGSSKTKPQPQKHYIEVKPIQAKRITSVTLPRQQTPSITSYNQNKKFLVVNGNGHTVKTSISREKIEQNGLHL